MVISASRY
jgi:hypothetical protein